MKIVSVELLPQRPDRLFFVLTGWMAVGLLSLFVHRLIFLYLYVSPALQLDPELQSQPFAAILKAWFTGIRFDLATLVIWIGPFALLLSFAASLSVLRGIRRRYRWMNRLFFHAQWIWLLCLHLVSAASTYNYSVNGKHLGWEFAAYFRDLPMLLAGSFTRDPVLTSLLALFIPVWIGLGLFIDLRWNQRIEAVTPSIERPAPFILFSPLIVTALAVLFFRGGLQENPLRPGDAMRESSPFLNHLKITGAYMIAHDLSDRSDFRVYYPREENIACVQRMLDDGRPFPDPDYPLLRYMEPRKIIPGRFSTVVANPSSDERSQRQPNFIILLMESWSAKFLAPRGYEAEVAPNFNRLIDQGVYFENFYASGGRSANGIFAILTGIPDRAGRTILRSSRIFNRFGSLPFLLKRKGYQTLFVHGGDLHFDNLNTGLPHLGFDHLVGMKEMEESGLYSRRWTMGFHDEDMYDMLLRKIDELYSSAPDRPFFAMAFTSNNHHPYGLPDPSFAIFPDSDPEAAFKNSYHYSDHALGKWIDRVRTKPYFPDTIIVIVADHSHHANLDYLQDREIPLLVYAPSFFRPERRRDIAGQLDLLPTVLSLSGGRSHYAAMGRDLTVPYRNEGPFAFFAGGSNTDIIGMVAGGFIYFHYLRSSQSVLLRGTRPTAMIDLQSEHPDLAKRLDAMSKHYYQFARTLEKENRIWPETVSETRIENRTVDRIRFSCF